MSAVPRSVSLLLLLLASWWIYQPGLGGPLLLDDWSNLLPLDGARADGWRSFLAFIFGNLSGPSGRPVSMLSFLLDSQHWPGNVAGFKQTNILIHLLCGLSIFFFSFSIFRYLKLSSGKAGVLAFVATSIWLLHPLNVSTVLYVVQRMTQLSSLFALLSLIFFIHGRILIDSDVKKGKPLLLVSLFPFALLALLSKENGALLLVSFAVLEFTLFAELKFSKAYGRWFNFGVLLPLALLIIYLMFTFGSVTEAYQYRHFSLMERLLTESRILLSYLSSIVMPQIADFGLYHDGVLVSTSLWQPISTVFAVSFVLLLLVIAIMFRKQVPVFSFSVLWFFGWHLLESTYIPLELYFEHRNYLPMLGPIIGACYYALKLLDYVNVNTFTRIAAGISVVIILSLGFLTFQLSNLWGNTGALISHWAEVNPGSKRAQSDLAIILGEVGLPDNGLEHLLLARQHYPNEITLLLPMWNYACTYKLEAPISLQQVAQSESLEYMRDDVSVHLRTLIDNLVLGNCGYPDQQQMLVFMDRVADLSMSARDRTIVTVLYSELLVHYGLIDEALVKLDLAFENEPSVDIAIRQSTLAGSVSRFQDALNILEKAYAADEIRGFLVPTRVDEIDKLRQEIEALLESTIG